MAVLCYQKLESIGSNQTEHGIFHSADLQMLTSLNVRRKAWPQQQVRDLLANSRSKIPRQLNSCSILQYISLLSPPGGSLKSFAPGEAGSDADELRFRKLKQKQKKHTNLEDNGG